MNIEDVFREAKVPYRRAGEHHHVTSGWLNVDCPNCSPGSGRFRLGWNLSGQYFSCWSCGKVNTYDTLRRLTRLHHKQITGLLKDIKPERIARVERSGTLLIPEGVGPLKKAHIEYLHDRGYGDHEELIRLWGIQGIGHMSVNLAWRLFIPIRADSRVVSWSTRSISPTNPRRYWTASKEEEECNSKLVLYGEEYVKDTIVVVEGFFDVWRIGPGAVCTMGTEYTRAQLLAISRYRNRYICFDASKEAQKAARKMATELMVFPGETYNLGLEGGKDPDKASKEEVAYLRSLVAS